MRVRAIAGLTGLVSVFCYGAIGAGVSGDALAQAAQSSTSSPLTASPLPPVHVDPPRRAAARTVRRTRQPQSAARPAERPASRPPADTPPAETARGPVRGYVATRSATGTKTDAALIDTPASVSVVSRQQISDQGAQSISQALRYTPGVFVDLRPSTRYDIVPVRGFGNNNGPLQSFVGYQDGLRLQRGISFAVPTVDPYALERIEVLRGPASILYGQTSLGGIVNLVSKRPTATPFGEVEFTTGSWGRAQAAFDVGGPVDAKGEWLYRLTGLGRASGTQVDFTRDERAFISPALTWRPTANTNLTILANYTYDPNSWYTTFLPARGTLLANPVGQIPTSFNVGDPGYERFVRKQGALGYEFEHRFNDVLSVRQNFRFMDLNTDLQGISPQGYLGNNPSTATLTRQRSKSVEQVDTFAVDNQVQAKFLTGALYHTALFGVDYQYADATRRLGSSAAGTPNINFLTPQYYQSMTVPAIQTDAGQINRQTGIYAQDQIKIGDLVLLGSVRHDRASYDFNQTTLATNTKLNIAQADEATTYRAGALYHFANGIAPYFSYSTSFEPVTGTAYDFNRNPFRPTTGEQFEAGVKFESLDKRILVTVAGYDLRQQNVQTPDPDPTHTGCVQPGTRCSIQTGEVHTQGIEVEARANLDFGLDLIGAYTYQDMKITRTNTATELGKTPVQVPDQMASLWALYHFKHLSPSTTLGGLSVGGGVRYVGPSFGDAINTLVVPSVTLVDAVVQYDLEYISRQFRGTRLSLNVSNLFDKSYVASCGAGTQFDSGCYYGMRRSVLATLRHRW